MPNTSVRAAAQGMPAISRRSVLGAIAAISTTAASTSAAFPAALVDENPDAELFRIEAEGNAALDLLELAFKRVTAGEEVDTDRFMNAAGEIVEPLLDIRARTPAGILAKLRIHERWSFNDWEILDTIEADVKSMAGAPSDETKSTTQAHPDANLLELGRNLDQLWERQAAAFVSVSDSDGNFAAAIAEADASYDAAYKATSDCVRKIEAERAVTLEGLRVKARAISWCYGSDDVDIAEENQRTTDLRIAQSILDDLLVGSKPRPLIG